MIEAVLRVTLVVETCGPLALSSAWENESCSHGVGVTDMDWEIGCRSARHVLQYGEPGKHHPCSSYMAAAVGEKFSDLCILPDVELFAGSAALGLWQAREAVS